MALAICKRSRQHSLGILAKCISPLMIWNGFPSSRNSPGPILKVWDWAFTPHDSNMKQATREKIFVFMFFLVILVILLAFLHRRYGSRSPDEACVKCFADNIHSIFVNRYSTFIPSFPCNKYQHPFFQVVFEGEKPEKNQPGGAIYGATEESRRDAVLLRDYARDHHSQPHSQVHCNEQG